ncbi:MAG: terminase large subunit [Desulfobacteraceae bacterium]|nr:terminase large subunit [Desulfobacteraceae bacterium]
MPTETLKKPRITKTWRKLLCRLPGYDPFRDAGDCWFEQETAQYYIDFIETCCTHIEGELAGSPFFLETWEKAIIANLFGWQRIDIYGRQVRRFREALVYVPRKNGKTPLAATIVNAVFFLETEEVAQQNHCAAGERDQAGLLFRHILGMIKRCEEMDEQVTDYKATKTILRNDEADPSYIKVLSKESETKHGGNPHITVVDELHVQTDRRLVDALSTAMASKNRAQPLMLYLTTADLDRPSICNEKYDYAKAILDGTIEDNTFLPVIYEATDKDDWISELTWARVNPNLGVSVSLEFMRTECKKARKIPAYENTFKRLHLNMRTEQEDRWIQIELWDENDAMFDPENLNGEICYASIDMSSKWDVTASGRLFPPTEDCPFYRYLCRMYIPADTADDREVKEKVPIRNWVDKGHLILTPGRVVNSLRVLEDLEKDAQVYDIRKVAIDRWQADTMMQMLIENGFDERLFNTCGQGYASLSAPTKALMEILLGNKLAHNANPVLRWMAGNVAVDMDPAENIKPVKNKHRTRWKRIDGIVALIMCLREALMAEAGSCYEERGIRSV